ncbi:MAG TPA: cytochrome P450 [Candidatus Binatia bacterium]|nr:cytochrome P450 [Candidatus Binatia bacterium]
METPAAEFDPQMLFDHPDPYPMFAGLRATMPVMRSEFMNRVSWVVTKYDDCFAILKDAETYSSRSNAEVGKVMGRTVIEMDGKEHTRHRALVQRVFVPKGLDGLQPVLENILHEIIDGFAADPAVDLIAQFTERFPVQVMAHMVGIPRADYPQFQKWAIEIIGFVKDYPRGYEASAAIREYLLPIIAERRAHPQDDVISHLLAGTVDGQGLSDDDIVSFLRLLIPAGAETTFRLIGNMLFALLTERDRYERVRADRSLVPWVIEETLRWETSVLMVSRQTNKPVTIRGVDVPENALVSIVVASANRDEEHYPNADVFDLDRRAEDHLGFGFGRHHCLGYHLARLEARVALNAILDRLPALRLDPDEPAPTITGLAFRSPKTLRALT